MGRPKNQVKIKEPVKVRIKPLKDGNRSVYLDIYWKGVRKYEYLKLYLIPETTPLAKQENKETLAIAERIKAERIKALRGHGVEDWETVKKGSMLLKSWLDKFCQGGVGVKESSLHPRKMMANAVNKYLSSSHRNQITLEEVDADFCRDFIKFLRSFSNSNYKHGKPEDHVISINTAQSYQGQFSTALSKAVRAEIIPYNPMDKLEASERIQRKEGSKEYLTIEEVQKLMVTDCYRSVVKQAFLFACFTGLRISDIYKITPMHIFKTPDGKGEYIDMEMRKTEKQVVVPLSKEAKKWLPKSKGIDIPYFDLPTTPSVIGRALRKWAEAAGIEKHISFHSSRHTFGTMMLTLGADLYTTSKLMGHSNVQVTEVYAKIVDKKKEEAINLIDNLFQ